MLLNFEERFNIKKNIWNSVEREDWFVLADSVIVADSCWLVGVEKGGVYLFKYNTISRKMKNLERTHVGVLYTQTNASVKTIYTFSAKEDIVQCSLNSSSSLLILCLSENLVSRRSPQLSSDKRSVFLVDVVGHLPKLEGLKYDVKIEMPNRPKKAQFLHQQKDKKQRFMVFEENDSVKCPSPELLQIYEIGCDHRGVITEPSDRPIKPCFSCADFLWYQWDIHKCCLYLLCSVPDRRTCRLRVFHALGQNVTQHDLDMGVPLDPENRSVRINRQHLDRRSSSRNIVMITSPTGLMCLCYQHKYIEPPDGSAPDTVIIKYTIYSFLHCNSTEVIRSGILTKFKQRPIHFSLFGSYLLAYLPGVFAHLINVNDAMEPNSLHILSKDRVSHIEAGMPGALTEVPNTFSRHSGVCFYDSASMKIYHARINEEALVEIFSQNEQPDVRLKEHFLSAPPPSLKLSVLHYALLYQKQLVRELLRELLKTPADPEVGLFMKEFIIGSAYRRSLRAGHPYLNRIIPFTTAECNRDHSVSLGGEQSVNALFRLERFDPAMKGDPGRLTTRHEEEEGYNVKFVRFLISAHIFHRFRLKYINPDEMAFHARTMKKERSSLARIFSRDSTKDPKRDALSSMVSSFSEDFTPESSIQSLPGPVAVDSEDHSTTFVQQLGHMIFEKCYRVPKGKESKKIEPFFKAQSHAKRFREMCLTYAKVLVQQSATLLQVLHEIFDLKPSGGFYRCALNDDMMSVLMVFERYKYMMSELGLPLPEEFLTSFTTIAYQASSPSEFLGYIDMGIAELTEGFLTVLSQDPDPDRQVLKLDCLSLLPKDRRILWARRLCSCNEIGISGLRYLMDETVKKSFKQSRRRGGSQSSEDLLEEYEPAAFGYILDQLVQTGNTGREITKGFIESTMLFDCKRVDRPYNTD